MRTAYTYPTNYDVRRDLIPQISPHLLYSLLTSSMDNLMTAHLHKVETCSGILNIAPILIYCCVYWLYVYIDIYTLYDLYC